MPRIVCISDTHSVHDEIAVPFGDILLHAGDSTIVGEIKEITKFNEWLGTLPHKHKIIIAGNHDWLFQTNPYMARSLITNAIYLEDSFCEVIGLKIYGSPWQPWFFDWAFNLPRGKALAEKWALIPEDTDVLITHGPPHTILDETPRGDFAGCEELLEVVKRIKPKLHVFGHIHHSYGRLRKWDIEFVNACNCDEAYDPTNAPVVVDL
jgi:predicted phosphohydrolase